MKASMNLSHRLERCGWPAHPVRRGNFIAMSHRILSCLTLAAALALSLVTFGCSSGSAAAGGSTPTGAPAVTLSGTALSFTAAAGATSASQSVTVTNSGTAALTISAISLSGTNPSSFSQTNSCTTVSAGASCSIAVSFAPSAAVGYSATLNITDNAANSPQTVSLAGTGTGTPALQLSSTTMVFSTPAGTVAAAEVLTLTNTGNAALTVTGVSLGGTNASSFSQTNTCTSVAAGGTCSVTVNFTATAIGSYSAGISIGDNASGSPQAVALTGTVNGPVINLSSSSFSFTTPAESTSATQTVTLQNTGNAVLNMGTIVLTGSNAANFAETTTCGASLSVGSTCAISLTFSPYLALVNAYTASVAIPSNVVGGATAIPATGTATGTLTINTSVATAWTISTGAINLTWNSLTGNVVSVQFPGDTDQLVDTTVLSSNGQPDGLYMDNTGTGTASCTAGAPQQIGNEYIDWWITCPSNSANAFSYSQHFVVTANDPGLHVYYVANHSATDVAGSLGQVQYVFRINQSLFTNTYSNNSGLYNLGATQIALPSVADMNSTDPGRAVQNAAEDLHGFTLPAGFGREFYTKYDYSSYEYLHQEHGLYGTQYGAWTIVPNTETLSGGPTKQDLIFTGNILMMETFSSHLDNELTYTPAQGVASTRLFGPYCFQFNQFNTTHTTAASLYAEAQQYLPFFHLLYDNEAILLSNGYTASTGRGTVAPAIAAGGSSTVNAAWTVLSDPAKNFQLSSNGLQYWVNDTTGGGTATLTGVVPGTYRLSHYVLGQWGELRYDGATVSANQTTTLPAMTFVPENFSNYAPIWTIGTPDRSAHEFLHGANTYGSTGSCTGCDDREYWGNWNFWKDFATTSGTQVYYATAEGATPVSATTALNYVQWGVFDPGLFATVYNAADDTTDGYNYAIPAYVAALPGASGTNGVTTAVPAAAIHFTTTSAQLAQGSYAILSLGLGCAEGSVIATLNGSQAIYHYSNASDCMIRSGLGGYYEWGALEWPTSVLKAAGQDNVLTLSVSQADGVMWDALRMEIGTHSANPSVTGWYDYGWGTSSTFVYQNDAVPNP
jgi:hypothetical protein